LSRWRRQRGCPAGRLRALSAASAKPALEQQLEREQVMRKRMALSLAALMVIASAQPGSAADMNKVLRVGFPVDVTGFDPQALNDVYSNYINRVIFEPLLAYDYLARPYKLVPNTAEALPEITDEGRKLVIRIRKGIYFTPDPAFNGKKRELTAADYIFSWKRLLDPKVRAPNVNIFENKLLGADELMAAARKSGKFDYDAPLAGLQALDSHTLQIRLVKPNYTLMDYLANSATGAVAREVIEKHADGSNWVLGNPVGTGPYLLRDWRKGSKVVIEANPDYRDRRFPESKDPADKLLEAQMKGKKLPAIGRIEVSIIEESNPRFLAFQSRQLDFVYVPTDFVNRVIDNGKLKPEFVQQGIIWTRAVEAGWTYTVFNMEDPVIGGYSREKIALRRAIGLGYNITEEIGVLRQGQGLPATQPIPPNLPGHDPSVKRPYPYDPVSARALLDRFGYKDCNGDGFRELPDCSPLLLKYHTDSTEISRQFSELWKKSMDGIGINIEFVLQKWPDTLKAAKAGKVMMWGLGGLAQVRDGEQFLASLYSKYIDYSNFSRFRMDSYDRLFELAQTLPDGPERTKVYRALSDHFVTFAPVLFDTNRISNALVYPWVQGWKMHSFNPFPFIFLDIDMAKQKAALK
jgi:ABC-type transport system substrate-binding protein